MKITISGQRAYWSGFKNKYVSKGSNGLIVVLPISTSCRKVLYLLIWVGRTSAEGIEKSQYRTNDFCRFIHQAKIHGIMRVICIPVGATISIGSKMLKYSGGRPAQGQQQQVVLR
jgi:hypothetical protein